MHVQLMGGADKRFAVMKILRMENNEAHFISVAKNFNWIYQGVAQIVQGLGARCTVIADQ